MVACRDDDWLLMLLMVVMGHQRGGGAEGREKKIEKNATLYHRS